MRATSHFNTTFLFLLIILVGLGAYFVFKPFLLPIVVAFVLSQLFNGWYKKILKIIKFPSLASLLSCLIIFFIIFLPLFFIGSLIVSESNNIYQTLQLNNFSNELISLVEKSPLKNTSFQPNIENFKSFLQTDRALSSIKNTGNLLFLIIKKTYQSTTQFIFMTFVMFFALYYFFKDHEKMIKKIMDLSPLKNRQEKLLLDNFINTSRATLKGSLVVAIIQGVLSGIILWLTGVPFVTLLGVISFFISLVPFAGPALILIPIGLILIFIGNFWQGVILIIFAILVVSTVDNFVRPKLVEGGSGLHPLLAFLSTLGGLILFGIAGFLLGPVIVVLFITLLTIYQQQFKNTLKKFNH